MLPAVAYARLWENQWSSGGGDALLPQDIDAAFVDGLSPMTGNEHGYLFVAGVDLGLTRDCSAVVVLAVPEARYGRIRLAHHKLWRPTPNQKIDLREVEEYLLDLDRQFALETVAFDPWQAELLASRLEAHSRHRRRNQRRRLWTQPWMREIQPSATNLRDQASLTIEYFGDHRLEFFPCEPLRRDLLKLRVEEKSYGIRLTSPRDETGHGDSFSAFALALLIGHELSAKRPTVVGSMFALADAGGTPYSRAVRQHQQRAESYQEEMEHLQECEADYSGREGWEQVMRNCGRM